MIVTGIPPAEMPFPSCVKSPPGPLGFPPIARCVERSSVLTGNQHQGGVGFLQSVAENIVVVDDEVVVGTRCTLGIDTDGLRAIAIHGVVGDGDVMVVSLKAK